MKKILLVTLLSGFACSAMFASSATAPDRHKSEGYHYNCRMPERHGHGHKPDQSAGRPGMSYSSPAYSLIGDMGLHPGSYSKCEKAINRYFKDAREADMKYGPGSRRPNPNRRSSSYSNAYNRMIRDLSRQMNPIQLRTFEQRFQGIYTGAPLPESAPRPGQPSLGPLHPGPAPRPMTGR